MSEDFSENEDDAVLRRIFLECLALSSSTTSPSTTSEVRVSTLVEYIRDNAFGSYRSEELLAELQRAMEDVSSNGHVNWTLFKKASRRWVDKVRHWQDSNNNIEKNYSNDDLIERSDDEKGNSEDSSERDRNKIVDNVDRCRKPKTPRRFVTADFVNLSTVSSYSPSSDTTHGCTMSTDTTADSADDTDVGSGGSCGDVGQVDLRLRVRRFDEENALLREELVRAEELSAGFQRQFDNLRRKLDHTNEKCRMLECENDEHKEILHEVEQKERDCRWALQKAEKERALLAKKLEEAEAELQSIASLTTELETCKKEKLDCARQAILCRHEAEDRQTECEMLREKLAQIAESNDSLRESYEETLRHLREQNQELKKQIFDLHSKHNLSDELPTSTPPASLLNCLTQSTPYSDTKNVHLQDSLYAELKASGFSIENTANDSRIRELEEELCWYNEEICDAIGQIENILESLNCHRKLPDVPNLTLDSSTIAKTPDIYELLQKISKLSNAVNEMIWKPKVKDASCQIIVDSTTHEERKICDRYGILMFEDCPVIARDKRDREAKIIAEGANDRRKIGFFAEAYSMNRRSIGDECANENEPTNVTDNQRETFTSPTNGSMTTNPGIPERTIIDPIVEELDRILQCTNRSEDLPSNCSPTKNPKFRCIYTCAQSTTDQHATDSNYSTTESTNPSPKIGKQDLATTYVIASGGDAPSRGMVKNKCFASANDTSERESMVETCSPDESDELSVNSCQLTKTYDSNTTEISESSYIDEYSIDEKLHRGKSIFENSGLSTSSKNSEGDPSAPRGTNEPSIIVDEDASNANGVTYRVTPKKSDSINPKRKISVFHRSFDVDTLKAIGEAGGPDTYRLTERSMSTPNAKNDKIIDNDDDNMELDHDCMKKHFFTNSYRTNANTSDSSDISSPETSLNRHADVDSPLTNISTRPEIKRPIILAPKLKLTLKNDSTRFIAKLDEKSASSFNDDEEFAMEDCKTVTKNVEHDGNSMASQCETYDAWKINKIDVDESKKCEERETIRPGDEIERGVTFRRGSFNREFDFSSYSLLSPTENSTLDNFVGDGKIETPSTVVQSSDGESTSCDSSPKRETPNVAALDRLASNYGKPNNVERVYTRRDPSKSRDSGPTGGAVVVSGDGYQTRNGNAIKISTSSSSGIGRSVGNYGSGGGFVVIRKSDEKANVLPAVALAMSSGEDSSDSECDPIATRRRNSDDELCKIVNDKTRSISPGVMSFVNGAILGSSTPATTTTIVNNRSTPDERVNNGHGNPVAQKPRERIYKIRRSLSESGCGRSESSCQCTNGSSIPTEFNKEEIRPSSFPSLTDARLHESGIANLSSSDDLGGSLSEADLERRSTALSVGLVTDRITLPRRMALSIRQRDQSERNLASEIQKMHQDIQDLAPLCIDRESLERVERVRHQLEMITQCAHRVSCTAETLGAVRQEHRISRAVLLADRYILLLRSRCEKLASNLAETKRILTDNNIVVEENNGELGDDLPRIRYRGMPTNNRTMMARRRASIATIFRPLGNFHDVTKDGVRQRNSVSGRVTLRRPSLSAESHKWEVDKLDRTDSSSSSIGELREIFEQAESRRNSREENNNVLRLHSSNLSIRDCENSAEGDAWTSTREEPIEELITNVDGCQESRIRTSMTWMTHTNLPWKPMLWCIIISFLLGFYMKHVVSTVNGCSGTPLKWWSVEELLGRYVDVKNDSPTPI